MLLISFPTCTPGDPVEENYFDDINKVKGKYKPDPAPALDSINYSYNAPERANEIVLNFSSTTTVDPDTGTNADLVYFFYYSHDDPAGFPDPGDFYDVTYYIGFTPESDFSGSPVVREVSVLSRYAGRLYFWITAYDGGRESDHSSVLYVDLVMP